MVIKSVRENGIAKYCTVKGISVCIIHPVKGDPYVWLYSKGNPEGEYYPIGCDLKAAVGEFVKGNPIPDFRHTYWTDKEGIHHYDEEYEYTVYQSTNYGWAESIHPLAVGVDLATAKSIHRHFEKVNPDFRDEVGQTYTGYVSRTWCTNHEDFEHEYNPSTTHN